MTARTWLATIAACMAFLLLCAALDPVHEEAQDVADDVALAQQRADLEAGRDALALQICQAELGPGTRVLWTVDGDLVCRPAVLTAQGGAQ